MIFEENKKIKKRQNFEIGIYFLIEDNEVVYVGQTTRGLARIYNHTDKKWNSYSTIKCKREELDDKEKYYIEKYTPKYNGTFNYNHRDYCSLQQIQYYLNEKYKLNKEIGRYDIIKFLKRMDYKYNLPLNSIQRKEILDIIENNFFDFETMIMNKKKFKKHM